MRDDIDKLPISHASKKYARLKSSDLGQSWSRKVDFYVDMVSTETNQYKEGFHNRDASGKVLHAMKGIGESPQVVVAPTNKAWDWNGLQRSIEYFRGQDFPNAQAVGAFIGKIKIGSVVYEAIPGDMIWIDHAWVHPNHRRRGVLHLMLNWLKQQNPGLKFEANVKHPAIKKATLGEASSASLQKAAQAWCTPTTSHKEMDPELATAFADILDQLAEAVVSVMLDNEEGIRAAAVKTLDGTIFTGRLHWEAVAKAHAQGKRYADVDEYEGEEPEGLGFVTTTGRFVGRREAEMIGARQGQLQKDIEDPSVIHAKEFTHYL